MALQKVTYDSVVKSADPNFNHKAAREAFDLVMKMDDDEAQVFVDMVVSNVTEELISKNLRELQRTLDRVIEKRVHRVKKAALKAAISGDEEAVSFAKALAEISKEVKPVWDESKVNRDPTSGRFRVKISHNQKKPIDSRTASTMGIKPLPKKYVDPESAKKLTPRQQAHYQDEYRQLANFLSAVQSSTDAGSTDILMHFQDKNGGRTWTERQNGTKIDWKQLADPSTRLIGVEARPTQLTAGGAAFGLMSALGRQPGADQTAWSQGINRFDRESEGFVNDWNAEVSGRNQNEQLYNRLSTGSKLVGSFAPPGSKVQLAARFSQFVGDHGSEAEQVFGPHARKTAYRYRGTSKTPDKEVVDRYNTTLKSIKSRNDVASRDMSAAQVTAARFMSERRTPDFEEQNVAVGELANWLMKESSAKPNAGLYNLQLASGNTPPSEGFVIDKNGQIVDQAIGYGDDHYLPFNLKNLKKLRGGQYIRTRSVGGLTTEDIYTGLMSGARRVTVVSRSGTFTVEFEPDFKGGRRYNDKALRMTKRYASILDAVQSQQVDRKSVSPKVRQAITDEVMEEYRGFGTPKEMAAEVDRRVQEFKENPEFSETDEKLARLIASHDARGQGRDVEDFIAQARSALAEEKEYKFRLNGNGYGAAQDALHEQFPYYIKSKWTARRDDDRFETALDRGYVEPGRNRPTYAAAGLFGNAARNPVLIGSRGKFSAAEADYQGRRGGGGGGTTPEPPKTPNGTLTPTGEKSDSVRVGVAEFKRQASFREAAQNLQNRVKELNVADMSSDDTEALNFTADDLMKPENQRKFIAFVGRLKGAKNVKPVIGEQLAAFDVASAGVGRPEWSPELAGSWGNKPVAFHGPAYEGNEGARHRALAQIDKQTISGIVHDKPLSRMSDAELADEHRAASELRNYTKFMHEGMDLEDKKAVLDAIGVPQDKPVSPALRQLLAKPDLVDNRLMMLHQTRALNYGVPDDKRNPDIVVPNAPKSAESAQAEQQGPGAAKKMMYERANNIAYILGEHAETDEDVQLSRDLGLYAGMLSEMGAVSADDIKRIRSENEPLLYRATERAMEIQRKNRNILGG